jgi:folylpolyglutamate synthase/dihydropteroate synthase
VERLHQEQGICTNWQVQMMKDQMKKYLHVARWQEATQNLKVKEMQSFVNQKRKWKHQQASDEGEVQQQQLQLRHNKHQVSNWLKAASTCEQHAEPLMLAHSHNVLDFRSNR